jgi:hypothetical protein
MTRNVGALLVTYTTPEWDSRYPDRDRLRPEVECMAESAEVARGWLASNAESAWPAR